MSVADDELLGDYLDEGREYLALLNEKFLTIEADPTLVHREPEIINETFRAAHSLKGLSAAFGLDRTNQVVHRMEHILDGVRNHEFVLNPGMIAVLYKALDTVEALTNEVQQQATELSDIGPIIAAIEMVMEAGSPADSKDQGEANAEALDLAQGKNAAPTPPPVETKTAAAPASETVRVTMERLDRLMNLAGELVIARSRFTTFSENMTSLNAVQVIDSAANRSAEQIDRLRTILQSSNARDTLAQGQDTLDALSRITTEILTHCDELQTVSASANSFTDAISDLESVTSGIQNTVMDVRMVGLDGVFKRFQRTVRDVASQLGKRIHLNMEGTDTEVDKRVTDELVNPLTHLVRNAADHGLETPKERREAGKPDSGTITLRGSQRGNDVFIEIIDDGRGMDPAKLKNHAIKKGVLQPEEANKLSDQEAYNLIFRPGFSTAEKVTGISGRGMGMDIVLEIIHELRGSITVDSKLGEGSTFVIRLPLTLSILTCLLVRIDGRIFAIPLPTIQELISIEPQMRSSVLEREMIIVRDEPIPLIQLTETLRFQPDSEQPTSEAAQSAAPQVVIVNTGGSSKGIIVDEMLRKEDLVVKPLAKQLSVDGISGSAILGDGQVTLILDPANMTLKDSPLPV